MTTKPLCLSLSCLTHHPYSSQRGWLKCDPWLWAFPTVWLIESFGLRISQTLYCSKQQKQVSGSGFNPSLSSSICHINISWYKPLLCLNLWIAPLQIWGVFCVPHLSASTSMGALPCDQLFAIQAVSNAARKPRAHPVPMGQNGWWTKTKLINKHPSTLRDTTGIMAVSRLHQELLRNVYGSVKEYKVLIG